jgi:hypothetical protein
MKPYAEIAVGNGYVLELLEPCTPWRYNESQLAHKNVHGVPRKQIENMLARFEMNLTGKSLLTKLKLKYPVGNRPPQPAVPPPQMKQKKKSQAPAVVPPEDKPKKRRKRSKTTSQQLQAPQQPVQPAQDVSLMDTLTLFLARKVLEEGQILDPKVANRRLSNGVTIGNTLLTKKQNVSELTNSSGAVKKRISHDSISSEGSVVISCGLVDMGSQVDNGGSSEDDSNEDESGTEVEGEEVERVEDDNDSEIDIEGLGEWQVSDNDCLYQSSDDGVEEEIDGTDNLEPVASGMQCWEYILVMDNSEWIYQKHHPEAQDSVVQDNPETTTEQVESLLINLSADSTDVADSDVDLLVNVEENVRKNTSTENLLVDIFSTVEDSLESGAQKLLSPVSAPVVAQGLARHTDSDASTPSHPFSLAEFDQWLYSLPVEPEMESILWQAPFSGKSKAASDIVELIREEPVRTDVTGALGTERMDIKTVELCPHALANSPVLVYANEENLVFDTDQASGIRPETTSSTLPVEKPEVCHPILGDTVPKLVPSPDTHQHTFPQTTDGGSKEDEYCSNVCSEEASNNGIKEVPTKENTTGAKNFLNFFSCKATPTRDLLTRVAKCNKEETWDEDNSRDTSDEQVQVKPDVCGFMEQRVLRMVRGEKWNESNDVEVPDTETMPPEVKAWETVADPAVSWENEGIQKGECKSSQGPQPQRSIFVSEEVTRVEQGWSDTCFASFQMPTLITPDDFMQNSRKNRLTEEVQRISFSNAGGKDSDVGGGTASRTVTDASTNTYYKDFVLISQLNRCKGAPEPVEGVRIVTAHNCNITEGAVLLKHIDRPVPVKLTLDKSSMTTQEDDYAAAVLIPSQQINADKDHNFAKLVAMFPNAPQDALKEIFEKCYGDLNWTVDLLLESKLEPLEPLSPDQDTEGPGLQGQPLPAADVSQAEPLGPPPKAGDEQQCSLGARKSWRKENDSKTRLSERALHLKGHLEDSSTTLSDASYSEDTLRMRKLRHGELLDMGEVTTKPRQSPRNSTQIAEESALGPIGCSRTRTPSPQSGDLTDVQRNSVADLGHLNWILGL